MKLVLERTDPMRPLTKTARSGCTHDRPPLAIEALESRDLLAVLAAELSTAAFARHQDTSDGPHTATSAFSGALVSQAQVGPPPPPFQMESLAVADAAGRVAARSQAGGVFPAPNPLDTTVEADATARLVENWIVTGAPLGSQVQVDVQMDIEGLLSVGDFAGVGLPDHVAAVSARLVVSSDAGPDQVVLDTSATNNSLLASPLLQFTQVPGRQSDFEVNQTVPGSFTIPAGEAFSVQLELTTEAYAVGPFEIFVVSDFESGTSGMTYSLSTSDPNANLSTSVTGDHGEIRGVLFVDENANAFRDPDELRLDGRTVYIDENGNGVFNAAEPSAVTDADGRYVFEQLAPGTYTVAQLVPAGWEQTHPQSTWTVTLAQNEAAVNRNFGSRPIPGTITGVVWHDQNGNGLADAGEPELPGWLVYLDENDNGRHDSGEPSVRSGVGINDGSFTFTGVPAGTSHTVAIESRSGWVAATPPAGAAVVVVPPGGTGQVEFGVFQANGALAGVVFRDLDVDGVRDLSEPGLPGIEVFLDLNDDGRLGRGEPSQLTDSAGEYLFEGLAPGPHTVATILPQHHQPTTAGRFGLTHEAYTRLDPVFSPPELADFDNDGFVDFVVNGGLRLPGEIALLLNDGAGGIASTQQAQLSQTGAPRVRPADFNGDGLTDLLVDTFTFIDSSSSTVELFVLLNDPADPGTLNLAWSRQFAPLSRLGLLRVADINGDHLPDIVLPHANSGITSVLLNDPASPGHFIDGPALPGRGLVLLVDLDDDGRTDLIRSNNDTETAVFMNDPAAPGTFVPHGSYPYLGFSFEIVDINQDGRLDLIGYDGDQLAAMVQDPTQDAVFLPAWSYATVQNSTTLFETRDMNGDGLVDIVVRELGSGTFPNVPVQTDVLLNNPANPGVYSRAATIPGRHLLADLNQDLLPDMVSFESQLIVHLSDSSRPGQFLAPETWSSGGLRSGGEIVDLNGDELPDILLESYGNRHYTFLINDPADPGRFLPRTMGKDRIGGQFFAFVDANRDGYLDIYNDSHSGIFEVGLSHETTRRTVQVVNQLLPTVAVFGIQPDRDRDGVADDVEAAAPNGGDGNGDGTPDQEQEYVASLPNAVDGSYVTLAAEPGLTLVDVRAVPAPPPSGGPVVTTVFPYGMFQYTIEGLQAGARTTVTMTVHAATQVNSLYKYGPTESNPQDHLYRFSGGTINGNVITIQLQDGQDGDADLEANGRIVDPAAPGVEAARQGGDVRIVVRRFGDVVMRGDQHDNRLLVEQLPGRTLRITGLDGTTVNGQSDAVDVALRRRTVRVDLADGDDEFRWQGSDEVLRRLEVDTGRGDDLVHLSALHAVRTAWMQTGPGDDAVRIVDSIFETAFIDTGRDDDDVVMQAVQADHLLLSTGRGEDRVALDDVHLRKSLVDLGRGDDQLLVEVDKGDNGVDSIFDLALLRTGLGDDEVCLGLSGDEMDEVRFGGSRRWPSILDMSGGDDSLKRPGVHGRLRTLGVEDEQTA